MYIRIPELLEIVIFAKLIKSLNNYVNRISIVSYNCKRLLIIMGLVVRWKNSEADYLADRVMHDHKKQVFRVFGHV